jgi:hypothetical protein
VVVAAATVANLKPASAGFFIYYLTGLMDY